MKAMSIFEILVVMGIFSMMIVLTFPYSLTLINRDRAAAEVRKLAYVVFQQQQDAYGGLQSKPYGVALYSDRYTVYTGTSLATAESQDTYYLNSPIQMTSISLGGSNELTFFPNSFRPQQSGTLSITDYKNTYRLEINSEGLISYYSL